MEISPSIAGHHTLAPCLACGLLCQGTNALIVCARCKEQEELHLCTRNQSTWWASWNIPWIETTEIFRIKSSFLRVVMATPGISWNLLGNAESQVPPQTLWVRIEQEFNKSPRWFVCMLSYAISLSNKRQEETNALVLTLLFILLPPGAGLKIRSFDSKYKRVTFQGEYTEEAILIVRSNLLT